MDELKALDEKIELIRNDTNAYGFDDDNKNIAEALELVSNMLKSNDNSIGGKGEKGDKGDKGEPFRYEDFTAEQLESIKGYRENDTISLGKNAGELGVRNTLYGHNSGVKLTAESKDNTLIGYNAGNGIGHASNLTMIGSNVGSTFLNKVQVTDIEQVTPIYKQYINDKWLNDYIGFNESDNTIHSSLSTIIGTYTNNWEKSQNRTLGSIRIGFQPMTGAQYRDYNNIVIGNMIYGRSKFEFNNNIVIGNNLVTSAQSGVLVIDNGINKRIDINEALIFGYFDDNNRGYEKSLQINGVFKINPKYIKDANTAEDSLLTIDKNGEIKSTAISDLKAGTGQSAGQTSNKQILLGGSNLLKGTALPIFNPNSAGHGTSKVLNDTTGYFVRITPDSSKNIAVYGFRYPNSHRGDYSASIDVRHSHTANISFWGVSVPPNVWTRVKRESYTNSNEFQSFNINVQGLSVDIRNLKLEKSNICSDWTPHVEEINTATSPTKIDGVFLWTDLSVVGITTDSEGNNRAIRKLEYMDFISTILEFYLIFQDGTTKRIEGLKTAVNNGNTIIPFKASDVGGKAVKSAYIKALLK